MATCFVMQPFDGGVFDRRYEDIYKPAIIAAGLEPYRVDKDPGVVVPIADIEGGIRDASICLAEITLDNPNVWYELGYAMAKSKPVVLICSRERTAKFPFDIQHRTIIHYAVGSISDFDTLRAEITSKLKAYLSRAETLAKVSDIAVLSKVDGLTQYEVVALASLTQNLEHPSDYATKYQIDRDMDTSGFTRFASTIALKSLALKGLVAVCDYVDPEINATRLGYELTLQGWNWVLENTDKFNLTKPEETIPF